VLGAERLKHKLGGLETGRDLEVGWNELGHTTDPRSSAQAEPAKRTMTWASVRVCLPEVGRDSSVRLAAKLPHLR
jgi:hypothetical protein